MGSLRGSADPFSIKSESLCFLVPSWGHLKYPIEDHPSAVRREPYALAGWIQEILYCDPKGSRAFLRILSTEGRGVRLCWAKSKPTGSKEGRGSGLC